jgi:outer membrane protein assembly factor BamB
MKNQTFTKKCALFSVFAVSVGTTLAGQFDWPQWQGPDRTAVSKETGLLQEWPKEGPPIAWKVTDAGLGYSAPSVANGSLFGMSVNGEDEVVWRRSEADGKIIWVKRVAQATLQQMPQGNEGPGCTPTIDGERLYIETMGGELVCLQVSDGTVLWQRSFTHEFGGHVPTWSYRESPLVDGNKVICTPGGDDALLVALNKSTGETIWKSKMPSPTPAAVATSPAPAPAPPPTNTTNAGGNAPGGGSTTAPGSQAAGGSGRSGRKPGGSGGAGAGYASAIAIDFEGQRQYVQFTAKALVGVAASDGKFLWKYGRAANAAGINCATPIYQNGEVFCASAYGAGGGLAKLTKEADGTIQVQEVYLSKKMQNHHGCMILLDGFLYGANGGNEGGGLVCLNFQTGDVLWNERDDPDKRAPKGSIAFADGRLYYYTEKGTMLLIEPNSKAYTERGRFDPPNRSEKPAWTHPVIANGKLYVRDQDTLICYNIKAEKT